MVSNHVRSGFVNRMKSELVPGNKLNKTKVEKIAHNEYGIEDKTEVKEYTELAIVEIARAIAHEEGLTFEQKYWKIVSLYKSQVNLSHRTSQSVMLQQYSTPVPIAYLCGLFTELFRTQNVFDFLGFEPSAGNGLLTIAGTTDGIIVNEIDRLRNSNLRSQFYKEVRSQDATEPFADLYRKCDAVITNPPFGTLDYEVHYDSFKFKVLDHLMALRALDCMKDPGRAAIIIGGHTEYDEKGRIQAGRNRIFFNYLYSRYNVIDVINIDGHKLYSRQGTAFDVRVILIAGRKPVAEGFAPLYNEESARVIGTFEDLWERFRDAIQTANDKTNQTITPTYMNSLALEAEALSLELLLHSGSDLGAPYSPASDSCIVLNTVVPDSMAFETKEAITRIKEAVGGDIDDFVRDRLQYSSKMELCRALSAEQIDAVAMAIYNIEARGQGMIIGDQTGIGKGRVAAAMVRYGIQEGLQPVFITEKANLFSDLYRDLIAIGSGHLVPFIVNGKESKTDIKDEDGNILHQALPPTEQSRIFKDKQVPQRYHFIMGTYSQFNSPEKKPEKPAFLKALAEDNLVIMDESHNSSGSSNTGEFLQGVLARTRGVVFLSATFAKRPDNMPVYAMKTCISEANMSKEDLVESITRGGVALQEVLASQLVSEGQMIRRERSFEGVEVNYITLEDKAQEHSAIADNITDIVRDIIGFQAKHIDPVVEELDDIAAAEGKEVGTREGTAQAGVDNQPYFSKVFQVIHQMLFSIKAEAVAERAIARLREGKKPVIAFASTMGSFIESLENEKGLAVGDGDVIRADFSVVLQRGLEGVIRYTEMDTDGKRVHRSFKPTELAPESHAEYLRIAEKIRTVATGITISPIDVIVQKIQEAGYSVAEVTGRKYELQLNIKTGMGLVKSRKKINTNDAFRQFNNNEVDVLLINQSGSTGASAHAIVTQKVKADKVRQRVMIVLQAELDINTEVQKRGRINRTGQILKPIYDYVNSAIPAEKRLMMMLQKKLKSLDANTTSNQKQSTKILDVPDFLNKYGDKLVVEYLDENSDVNALLGDPLKINDTESEQEDAVENAAHRVSGRVAVLSTKMQQEFYNEISSRYNDYTDYLKQIGEYDLEVEAMDLQAETVTEQVVKMGKGGESEFGDDSILQTIRANVLKKPFTKAELENLVRESLGGREPRAVQEEMGMEFEKFSLEKLSEELAESNSYYDGLIDDIPKEKKIQKILKDKGAEAFDYAVKERRSDLEEARQAANSKIRSVEENKKQYLLGLFRFYYPGKPLNYPVFSYDGGAQNVFAVFVGFIVDHKKKNPYAPSALKLRFAIASSNKYIAMPASYTKDISAITGASYQRRDQGWQYTLMQWEESIKAVTHDRAIRYVVTGNLLQAFSDFKGKLVSYTTKDGGIEKGILMPEYWLPKEGKGGGNRVSVPVTKLLEQIKGMRTGQMVYLSGGMSISRSGGMFRIMVPASKAKGGIYYLDKEVLELVDRHIFEKISTSMVAYMADDKLGAMLHLLQSKFNTTADVPAEYLKQFQDQHQDRKEKVWRKLEIRNRVTNDFNILAIEAEALALELELLNLTDTRLAA